MARLFRRWRHPGEKVLWKALANRGPSDTRQVGGRLFVTDERLVFEPIVAERFAEARRWEASLDGLEVSMGPGSWRPRLPVLRPLALRYEVTVRTDDGREEHFFVTHVGEPLERLAGPGTGGDAGMEQDGGRAGAPRRRDL